MAVTGALDDNEISLDEVNFAVLTKSDTVSQLSDLYLNIDDLASALDFNGDNYISSDELLASATQLWVDADRDFEVGEGELLGLPEYFDIYLPGQAYEGASTGGLSIIEHADAYVRVPQHLFIHLLVEFLVLEYHMQALRLLLDH